MTSWMIALLLAGPPVSKTPADSPLLAKDFEPSRQTRLLPAENPNELRQAYRDIVSRASRHADPEPAEVIPELVALFHRLQHLDGFSHAERSHMQAVVEARLQRLRAELIRKKLRLRKAVRRARLRRQRSNTPSADAKSLPGGAELARARELIDLIQSTIAPDTWEAAGGKGRISYFPLLHVLVIRQTGEVHHRLGNTLEALRGQ